MASLNPVSTCAASVTKDNANWCWSTVMLCKLSMVLLRLKGEHSKGYDSHHSNIYGRNRTILSRCHDPNFYRQIILAPYGIFTHYRAVISQSLWSLCPISPPDHGLSVCLVSPVLPQDQLVSPSGSAERVKPDPQCLRHIRLLLLVVTNSQVFELYMNGAVGTVTVVLGEPGRGEGDRMGTVDHQFGRKTFASWKSNKWEKLSW